MIILILALAAFLSPLQSDVYHVPFFNADFCFEDDPSDSVKSFLKQGIPYEGNINILIDQMTEPGSVAIDMGAHVGIHTITMSRKVGPTGRVIAFEPNPKLYQELLQTLQLNKCTNVTAICKGLGAKPKTETLDFIKIEKNSTKGETIEIIPLDSLELNNISLIKMDVENYEYFVLRGARKTILRNKPVIIFECWIGADYEKSAPEEKANFDRVRDLLESYGYEIYVIYCNDFIAFPKDVPNDFKKLFKKLDMNNFNLGL